MQTSSILLTAAQRARSGRRSGVTCAVLAVALLAAACGSGASSSAAGAGTTSAPPANVTLALALASYTDAPVDAAVKLGYFKQENLNVKIVTVNGSSEVFAGVESGSVQFGQTNGPTLLQGAAEGIPLVAVGGMDKGFGEQTMVVSDSVAKARGIKSGQGYATVIRKLQGETVGVLAVKSSSGLMVQALVRKLGLPSNYLNEVGLDTIPAMVAAMQHGSIAAFFNVPPAPQEAVAQHIGIITFTSASVPGMNSVVGNVLFTSHSYLASHGSVVQRMVRALARADNAILDPKTQAAAVAAVYPYFPTTSHSELKSEIVNDLDHVRNAELDPAAFQTTNQVDTELGLLPKPLTASQLKGVYTTKYVPATYVAP